MGLQPLHRSGKGRERPDLSRNTKALSAFFRPAMEIDLRWQTPEERAHPQGCVVYAEATVMVNADAVYDFVDILERGGFL